MLRILHGVGVLLVLAVGVSSAAQAQESGNRLALLVGVDKYPSGSGFSALPFPQRDVDALAKLLLESGYRAEHVRVMTAERGFKDDLRFLPSRRNILNEFRLMAGDRNPGDSFLVALVGHGLTRRVKGKDLAGNDVEKSIAFFGPSDADIRDTRTMISLDELFAELENCRAGAKVMLVDACRDNRTRGSTGAIPFAPPAVPASVAAMFSCSDGEVAWEDADLGGGHGVFFHYVIEGLKGEADGNKDGKVSLLELTEYTQDKVPDFASNRHSRRQMPVLLGRAERVTLLELAKASAPEVITTRTAGIKLKLIPGGEFMMGSPDADQDSDEDEKPQHRIEISRPFYLGVTEVTQEEYEAVMGANPSWFSSRGGGKDLVARQSTGRHPVEQVSWLDAVAFCNKLSGLEGRRPFYRMNGKDVLVIDWNGDGYRLPTEAEWEYACRAWTKTRYIFGDEDARANEFGWFGSNAGGRTHPAGEKHPNGFGLFDMHGNVWEWCGDWCGEEYYANAPVENPRGPGEASSRVIRGGGWVLEPRNARSANRGRGQPGYRNVSLGFRLARGQSRP